MMSKSKKISQNFIRLYRRGYLFPTLIAITFIFLVAFRLHGSSIGIWEYIHGYKSEGSLVLGSPRGIRGDEWLIVSPLNIAQSQVDFALENPNVGLGQNAAVLTEAPVKHWSTFFRPANWGYFFLPLEYAFAFKWWFGRLLIILAGFLLFNHILKRQLLSFLLALSLYFTPFIQWWQMGETITFPLLILYFLRKLSYETSPRLTVINTLGLIYFSVGFVLILYPPFQVAISLAILAYLTGLLLSRKVFTNRNRFRRVFAAGGLSLLFIGLIGFAYFTGFKPVLNLLQATEYPGHRISIGGAMNYFHFWIGFFNVQLVDDVKSAGFFTNQSEASSFFWFYPFVIPAYGLFLIRDWIKKRRVNWLMLSLSAYLILITTWLFFGLPPLLAKSLLLIYVPVERAVIGLGLANFLLIVHWLKNDYKFKGKIWWLVTTVPALIFGWINYRLGYFFLENYPLFIQKEVKIVAIAAIAALLVWLLLNQKKYAFAALLLIFTLYTSYRINPIYQGLAPITQNPLSWKLQAIDRADEGDYRWVVYENLIWGNYLIANGINSISSTYLYPQPDLWTEIDPANTDLKTWNRYANIYFSEVSPGEDKFELIRPDQFIVNLEPCDPVYQTLSIRYFLFNQAVDYSCLNLVESIKTPNLSFYIYSNR